jgi:hypothetical protein
MVAALAANCVNFADEAEQARRLRAMTSGPSDGGGFPADAGGGTEVSGGSYARATRGVNSDTAWEATQGGTPATASSGTGGATQNPGAITFPAPTANWGVVTHIGIFDAASGGNLLFHGALTASKTINNLDPAPSFAIGDLDITLA